MDTGCHSKCGLLPRQLGLGWEKSMYVRAYGCIKGAAREIILWLYMHRTVHNHY